jgi:hypothetical protein
LPHLYVVQRSDQGFRGFCARLLSISETPPRARHLIPAYYIESGFVTSARFWLTVEKFREVDSRTIDSFQIRSTGKPLTDVLTNSMASVMIISR